MIPAARTTSLLTAVATVTVLELLRVAGTLATGSLGAAVLTVLAFAGAAGAGPLVWWLGVRRALPVALAALAVARLAVQVEAVRVPAVAALAAALALATLVLAVRRCAAGDAAGPGRATRAIALGVAADVALRLTLDLWDPVWRGGVLGWLLALALAGTLAALAGSVYRGPVAAAGATGAGAGVALASLGPALALYGAFLASPGFVASQAGVSLSAAGLWIAAGSLLGIAALSLPSPPWPVPWLPRRVRLGSLIGSAAHGAHEPNEKHAGDGGGATARPGPPARPSRPAAFPWAAPAVLTAAVPVLLVVPTLSWLAALAGLVALPVTLRAALGHPATTGRGALTDLALAGGGCGLGYLLLVLPSLPRFFPQVWPVMGAFALGGVAWLAAGRDGRAEPGGSAEPGAPARPARGPARLPRPFLPLLLATLLLAFPPLANAARPAPEPLPTDTAGGAYRLLSWNVHHAVNGEGDLVPDDVLRVIRASRAHVVVLQEVPRGWPAASGLDLVAWLERELSAEAVWAPAADRQSGNLILTSLPVLDSDAAGLPRAGGEMDRSYVSATVRLTGGESARIIATHLEGGNAGEPGLAQLNEILDAAREDRRRHTVIAGDFNAEPDSAVIDTVVEAGYNSAQDEAGDPGRPTHLDPRRRVDWIFGTRSVTFDDFRMMDSDASDHRPLAVTVWLD